jgi:heme/copper-type cytochrome/quinol oxidase subunit 1
MPRRYVDYADVFSFWHEISRMGAFISIAAIPVFFVGVWKSLVEEKEVVFGMRSTLGGGDGIDTTPRPLHTHTERPFTFKKDF